VIGAACLVPLAAVVVRAAAGEAPGTPAVFTGRILALLSRSLGLAAAVTGIALVWGAPMGVLLGRARIPGRRSLLALHALPVFLPPLLLALGWFHLVGREGLLGGDRTAAWLFARPGLVLVLAATLSPVVTICTAIGVGGVESALVDAGRLAAPPLRVAALVLAPLAWPAIAVGAMLVFTLAFAEVAVPMFLRVDVYPAAVFSRLGGLVWAPGEAALLALPVLLLALALVALERSAIGRRGVAALTARVERGEPLPLGRATGPAFLLAVLGAAVSCSPVAALAWRAVGGQGFADAWGRLGGTVANSVAVAVLAATGAALVAMVVGHGIARGDHVAGWLDGIALAAFLAPAAVAGVGAIAAWNRPATAWLYGSTAMLVMCLLGRYAVVAIRVFGAGVRQRPASHEEAAAVSGAGYLRRLALVVCPENRRALAGAWLLAMLFCLRDVETAILVYPPGGETLPVRIFTLEANGPEPTVAALALIHVAVTTAALALLALLLSRRTAVVAP
jgi:iron(III) transport system permease protein